MSFCIFIASDTPLETVVNPHYKTLSVREAQDMGMDLPESMLKSEIDPDQADVILWSDIEWVMADGKFCDGGYDDDFALLPMEGIYRYTEKAYGVYLEWSGYTEGRAKRIIEYLKRIEGEAEIWAVWLSDTDAPITKRKAISIEALEPNEIAKLEQAVIWEDGNGDIPTNYCLKIACDACR